LFHIDLRRALRDVGPTLEGFGEFLYLYICGRIVEAEQFFVHLCWYCYQRCYKLL